MLAYYVLCQEQEEEDERLSGLDPLDLSDEKFLSVYRTDKKSFILTCDLLRNDLKPGTNGFSVELQVLSTLRLLGTGSYQNAIAGDEFVQMSQATVSRNLNKVVAALVKDMREYITFPVTSQDQLTLKKGFYKKCGMPNILGIVDCMHIEVPNQNLSNAVNYLNRKGTYSINVLLACDANGSITNIVARWPGGAEDSDIWKNSNLRSHLEESSYNGYFLGDNSFSCDPWLITPYPDPKKDFEIAFNERIQKAMTVIEQVIRMLKTRFRCLRHLDTGNERLNYAPKKLCQIITVCCILHNIWHKNNPQDEDIPDDFIESQWPLIDLKDQDLTLSEQGVRLRDKLATSLHRVHIVRNVEVVEDASSQSEFASDSLYDNSAAGMSNADMVNQLICAAVESEEQTLRDQGSKLRDELAANLFANDMDVEEP